MPRSEAAAWREVRQLALESYHGSARGSAMYKAAVKLIDLADEMVEQVSSGVHANPRKRMAKNPGLVIWPNPGSMLGITFDKLLSRRAIALQYKHVADKLDYQHDFDAGVDVVTALTETGQRVVVLTARDGRELWADF